MQSLCLILLLVAGGLRGLAGGPIPLREVRLAATPDPEAPRVFRLNPPAGRVVRQCGQVEVLFDRPVSGVDAADLFINDRPAQAVVGAAAGPYVFVFPKQPAGTVRLRWADDHGIVDAGLASLPFVGGAWVYGVDPARPLPDVRITEFMARNVSGLRDADGQPEDWIEIENRSLAAVDLDGWALTDDASAPGKWVFPSVVLDPGAFLVVFASGKDLAPADPRRGLHTSFRLGADGEYLGLYNDESPRVALNALAPGFPAQFNDHSYGLDPAGDWRFYFRGSPGRANPVSPIRGTVAPVHFSVERGLFSEPFDLSLHCATEGAQIRFTVDGSTPGPDHGQEYTGPFTLVRQVSVRAAAFREGHLPSEVATHTYYFRLPPRLTSLPLLSVVTDRENLYGPTGIMEVEPRNTTQRGLAWERPVSVELVTAGENGRFQVDCGMRVQGGNYIRQRYDYRTTSLPESKYSFRLYFRGDYGPGRLEYPLIPGLAVDSLDKLVLRAGMNDPVNPFLRDEYARRLFAAMGQVGPLGTFVQLHLNGRHAGYYNPTERVDSDFLADHLHSSRDYDVIAQFGEVREGDGLAWNQLRQFVRSRDLGRPEYYDQVERLLDTTNFADYLLAHAYADTGDWPHNNWRAARERVTGARWRFIMWDAEWSFGWRFAVSHNPFTDQLGAIDPRGPEIQELFLNLQASPEWRLLFADRAHRHLSNGGALTDARLRAIYAPLRDALQPAIGNFDNAIETTWIPARTRYLTNHLARAGLWASDNAPRFSRHGGTVPQDYALTMLAPRGAIYYTVDGTDPRVRHSGAAAPSAIVHLPAEPLRLTESVKVKARTLDGAEWSALTEADFQVAAFGSPLRIAEIMYHPSGGEAYEFIELVNTSSLEVELEGLRFDGIDFGFPAGARLAGNARLLLASDRDPAAFARRYPGVTVDGHFGGALANGGERLVLVDSSGRAVVSVDYRDDRGWPVAADGAGSSLEIVAPLADPDDPANWQASRQAGGSPGQANPTAAVPPVRLNEIMAANVTAWAVDGDYPDWIEVHNPGGAAVDLAGWTLHDGNPDHRLVFSATVIPPGGYLLVICSPAPSTPTAIHSGFGLDREGEFLELLDADGRRVDAMRFGPQVVDRSLGRLGSEGGWALNDPTPGRANEGSGLAGFASLVVNEFLPDAPPGEDDWIEVGNRDTSRPAPLQGVWIGVDDALFQILAPGFVPAGGHVLLPADASPGPNHLDLRLPADQGEIRLLDPLGVELDRVRYNRIGEGISAGRLPDLTGSVTPLPGAASPGAPNYRLEWSGPVINEILARSHASTGGAADPAVDWIELLNPGSRAVDLRGYRLAIGDASAGGPTFPAGVILPPQGLLVVHCDPERPTALSPLGRLNVADALSAAGDTVTLFAPDGRPVSEVRFGFQLRDRSIGSTGTLWTLLEHPTPGEPNAGPAALGDPVGLRLNEWLAGGGGEDWIELFNPGSLPVSLTGMALADDPSVAARTRDVVPALSFIGAGDFAVWKADGDVARGPDHLTFALDARGETLRLYAASGAMVDQAHLGAQPVEGSQGRFPDGEGTLEDFPSSASPGEANFLPHPQIVINEVLPDAEPPWEGAIEVRNLGTSAIDLGGWWLSDDPRALRKYAIPAGTVAPGNGFAVVYEAAYGAGDGGSVPFGLAEWSGGAVVLAESDADGHLTGRRAVAVFGPSEPGVSWGRHETSVGADFGPLVAPTFGVDRPLTPAGFRSGTGAPNAAARVGPVVISEIMYHPAQGAGGEEVATLEYLELENISPAAVDLFVAGDPPLGWRLAGGVEFDFGGVTLPAGGRLLVVPDFPDAGAWGVFLGQYGLGEGGVGRMVGPFRGRLADEGERLRLLKPLPGDDWPADPMAVTYAAVDEVVYAPRAPWPAAADGGGFSLQRRVSSSYGSEPLNWFAGAPTPLGSAGAMNGDVDDDGLPDEWEWAHELDPWSGTGVDGPDGDPDGDGWSNREEYEADSDPRRMTVRFSRVWTVGDRVYLAFRGVAGRHYRVEVASGLGSGAPGWQTLTNVAGPAESREVSFWTVAPPAGQAAFYRLLMF
ncbi:MAG: lamin tail domain-containing protein [Verrucomicrobiales bacterium]|nr:lamin tail domain-containing protein [Verrucomicrobiales bacterium]